MTDQTPPRDVQQMVDIRLAAARKHEQDRKDRLAVLTGPEAEADTTDQTPTPPPPGSAWEASERQRRGAIKVAVTPAGPTVPRVDVQAFLARRLTRSNIDEHDFLMDFDAALRRYFEGTLNSCGGDDEALAAAIDEIAGYAYQRFNVLTPAEVDAEAGRAEEPMTNDDLEEYRGWQDRQAAARALAHLSGLDPDAQIDPRAQE